MKPSKNIIPYGIYKVSSAYLDFLRQKEPHVLDSNHFIYCGPLINKNDVDFFAPILNDEELDDWEQGYNLIRFHDGRMCFVDLIHMIPCKINVLTKINDTKHMNTVIAIKDELIDCAEIAMKKYMTKK